MRSSRSISGLDRLGHRLGELGRLEPPAQLDDLRLALAELVLDGLELLAQHVLALRVGHLLLGLGLDLALELQHLDLARERLRHRRQLHLDVVLLEEPLLVLGLHVEEARDEVADAQRVLDLRELHADLGREARGQREGLVGQLAQAPEVRLDRDVLLRRLGQRLDQRLEDRLLLLDELGAGARHALDDDAHALGRADELADERHRADLLQVAGRRVLGLAGLEEQEEHPVAGERLVHGLDRLGARDRERRRRQRQHHRVAHRQDRQLGRQRGNVCDRRIGHGYEWRRQGGGRNALQCTPISGQWSRPCSPSCGGASSSAKSRVPSTEPRQ